MLSSVASLSGDEARGVRGGGGDDGTGLGVHGGADGSRGGITYRTPLRRTRGGAMHAWTGYTHTLRGPKHACENIIKKLRVIRRAGS